MDYDRVTSVLGYFLEPELVDWKIRVGKREANRISRAATKIGTRVHESVERILKGEDVKDSKAAGAFEFNNCIGAFRKFASDYELETEEMEVEVVSEELGVVGHYDWLGKVNGKFMLLDWKTSRAINSKYWVQVNTYAYLAGFRDISVGIVRLDKNLGEYEFQSMKFEMEYVDVFEAMLSVYRYFNYNKHMEG